MLFKITLGCLVTFTKASLLEDLLSWGNVDFDKYNTGADMTKTCDAYTDCFNCSLSNCFWNAGVCGLPTEVDQSRDFNKELKVN